MDKAEVLSFLKYGATAWNLWRKANRQEAVDISRSSVSGLYLREFDFSYVDATGTDFSNCDLQDASFAHGKCDGANFRNASLYGADFRHASLDEAVFGNSEVDSADFRNAAGLTQDQINVAIGNDDTQLPSDLVNPWYGDYDIDPSANDERSDEEYEVDESEIPEKVVAPLQARWSGQRLVASLDSRLASKIPIADAALAVAERLERLKGDLSETNADRRLIELVNEIGDSLREPTRRNVFKIGFTTEELQYSHDRLRAELSPVLEARMMSCVVALRDLLSMFPDWQEFEAAKEFDNFRSNQNMGVGISESHAFIDAMVKRPAVIDGGIPSYLDSLRKTGLGTPKERFGYFSSLVNVLSKMFSAVLEGVDGAVRAAIAEETKTAIKWILRVSAGIVVWFITYVTGAYPWIKAAWEVVKSLL